MSWDSFLDAAHAWVVAGSGLDAQQVAWGGQDAARPPAPAIVMHVSSIRDRGSWVDHEDNPAPSPGQEIAAKARGLARVTLELRCHADPEIGSEMAVAILQRVRARRELPGQQALLEAANASVLDVGAVRGLASGTRDVFLFEPCARLDVQLSIAVEETEYLTIIERVIITNEIAEPDYTFVVT